MLAGVTAPFLAKLVCEMECCTNVPPSRVPDRRSIAAEGCM
jgi:hypothetical protein